MYLLKREPQNEETSSQTGRKEDGDNKRNNSDFGGRRDFSPRNYPELHDCHDGLRFQTSILNRVLVETKVVATSVERTRGS